MNESLPITFYDYLSMAARRKWLIIGAVLLSLGIAGILALVLPKSYRSSTLILVEDQKIPEDYVKAIVGGSIEGRLIMIKQQVMSRTLLSKVVEEFKLYPDDVRSAGFEEVIEKMRESIKVETVGSSGARGKTVEAFSISFAHEDPMVAMKVTAKLASLFIEENLRVREQFVEGASEFLEQELAKSKAGLEAQEQLISDFKKKYMGELPQQMEANLRALDRLQSDVTVESESINSLTDRVGLIDKAIRDYETSGTTTPGLGTPGGDPLVQHLRELERNLTTLKAGYKESYPDIVQVKQEIESVKAQLVDKHSLSGREVNEEAVKTFDPYLQGLVRQRDEAQIELAGLKQRRIRLASQMQAYEGRVERTPSREQELMILVRDYDNGQKNYQSLLDKRVNAQVAENLEKRQKGEQFRIIDPANLPEKTEKPDQMRIMLVGLILGCMVGFGGAFAVDQYKASFRRPEEAEMLLGLPLLAAIPDFKTAYGLTGKALPAPQSAPSTQLSAVAVLPGAAEASSEAAPAEGRKSNGRLLSWSKFRNGNGQVNGNGHGMLPVEYNLVAKWRPMSIVAEQFRVAATRLGLMAGDRPNTVVVVSSALKGEGKTASAVNLAYTLARDLGKTTLLIDCDLKNPSVHTILGTGLEPGLSEVLQGTHTLEDSIHPLEKWPLWILPAGSQENGTIELSKVHQLAKLLTELRRRFDYIILDAPPILPLADMNVLASMADVLGLVIKADVTSREVVQKALNSLKPTIQSGIILTGVWTNGIPYYMQERHPAHRVSAGLVRSA